MCLECNPVLSSFDAELVNQQPTKEQRYHDIVKVEFSVEFVSGEPRVTLFTLIEIPGVKHYAMEEYDVKYKSEPEKGCGGP